MIDIMLSNSDFETNVFQKSLWYNNKIEKLGHPRNDIFFNITNEKIEEIKQKLNIDKDTKILLYVPSWRDNLRIDCYNIDYKRLRETLENKTNQKWNIITRFHSYNIPKLNYLLKDNSIDLDVTLYSDIQELLAISDIIISDYSSCMFDFMLTKNPCFVYATDIEQYDNERGFYYPLSSTPFPIARNNDELIENIQNFDNNLYKAKCEEFLKEKDSIDDGNSSKRAVELIKDVMKLK
jgi:CDP-glycerol glycerophosphotransferase